MKTIDLEHISGMCWYNDGRNNGQRDYEPSVACIGICDTKRKIEVEFHGRGMVQKFRKFMRENYCVEIKIDGFIVMIYPMKVKL